MVGEEPLPFFFFFFNMGINSLISVKLDFAFKLSARSFSSEQSFVGDIWVAVVNTRRESSGLHFLANISYIFSLRRIELKREREGRASGASTIRSGCRQLRVTDLFRETQHATLHLLGRLHSQGMCIWLPYWWKWHLQVFNPTCSNFKARGLWVIFTWFSG